MYYEKWGFMLIFWNLAGVPLSYCHCSIYIANHDPEEFRWPRALLVFYYFLYLFVYWVWDTANGQKNSFRQDERGGGLKRKTFPQLPWQKLENPETIETEAGTALLVDGWCMFSSFTIFIPSFFVIQPLLCRQNTNTLSTDGMARKIHYTCDMFFALSWALVTGFRSPFPWFYPIFFSVMIAHRANRDIQRCREKYGDAWKEYERRVPWLFIPVSDVLRMISFDPWCLRLRPR